MTKHMYYLILLCLGTTVASGVEYIITPSQPQYCVDQCNSNSDSVDNSLTLSQFVNNSIDNLIDNTTLIFPPGSYSLESEFIIENFYSFSMIVWPASSSVKVAIVCGSNARFEFRNVSIVTVSGLEFVGCFNNHVISVGRFQFEDSSFLGHGHAIVSGTVLTIDQSAAHLDGVSLVSIIDKRPTISSEDRMIGILLKRSVIRITQSWFEGNKMLGGVIFDKFGSNITIVNTAFVNNRAFTNAIMSNSHGAVKVYNSKFMQNLGAMIFGDNCDLLITNTKFINNYSGGFAMVNATDAVLVISHCTFTNNNNGRVLDVRSTNMSIRYSDFIGNNVYRYFSMCRVLDGKIATIDHSTFINNTGQIIMNARSINIRFSEFVGNNASNASSTVNIWLYGDIATSIDHCKFINNYGGSIILYAYNKNMSITYSEFINNTVLKHSSLIHLDGVIINVGLNEFINNRAGTVVVYIANSGSTAPENLTNNVFIDNSATYEVFVNPLCRGDHNHSLSLGSSHCITCHEDWHQHLIGIVIAAFIAGIALVIVMLALNMTVAVGTLNGILFFANIVAANADTYFSSFETPNIVTVFTSWLNLDLGFAICFFVLDDGATSDPTLVYKALMQLAFPAYVTFLVIIVVVFSEYSSKFAKVIGKGNPVAVLATMILLSYAKFINATLSLVSFFYLEPAQGSNNIDVTRLNLINALSFINQTKNMKLITVVHFLIVISALILFLCIIYTALVFSWQWLLQYQDKIIFKWVRYQKLRLFLEPYHAPYTANYRYWTGLLLFVRALLYLISGLNFSLDPRVDLMSTIFVVGGLLLLKGVTAKRVYKNWPLDVIEIAIYFNLVAFSALTWYNLDFGGNQAAVAYTSVMIIFILLLAVIVFHVLRYTRLYKCSCVAKAFKWTSIKLMEKKPKEEPPNYAPEELDGYQLERTAPGDQELPTVTYSVIEIRQPTQNQEQTY